MMSANYKSLLGSNYVDTNHSIRHKLSSPPPLPPPPPQAPLTIIVCFTDGSTLFQKDGMSDKSPLQMLAQTCSQIGADPGDYQILNRKYFPNSSTFILNIFTPFIFRS